jgi:hypothetical protein
VALGESVASAAVPPALATAASNGAVGASAAVLAKAILKTMWWTKMKMAAILLLTVGVIGLGAGWALLGAGADRQPGPQASASTNAEQPKAPELPEKIRGQKVLVAFDVWGPSGGQDEIQRRTTQIEQALKHAGVELVEKVSATMYLVDTKGRKPTEVLKDLHYRQGAMVFKDGQYLEALPYENFYHKGQILRPEPFACLWWGSASGDREQMKRDIDKYSSMPGVVAETFDAGTGQGNNTRLKLLPAKGKTLLEVFLLVPQAGFHYSEKKAHE